MYFQTELVKLLLIISVGISKIEGYRILGVFPLNSNSHNNMLESLMKGLAIKGHQVDVITHFEMKSPPKNYKVIVNLNGTLPSLKNSISIEYASQVSVDPIHFISTTFGNKLCELLSLEKIQQLIKHPPNDPPYDLVITETFSANCFIGLGYVLKVPVITVSTILEFPWALHAIGNPQSTAFSVNVFMDSAFPSSFFDRLKSTVTFHLSNYRFFTYTEKAQTEAMRKYLSPNIPSVREVETNIALMFTNSYHSLFGIRPITPAFIELAGIHVEQNDAKLSSELKLWMDESTHGVVYFSLGSMILIETLPKDTMFAIYSAFAKIAPVKVLMKIANKDKLPPGLPKNVLISPWIPQVPVLKHPNTKVFITHGGLMGIQEALYYGVPMIGMPLFTDQFLNINILVRKNMAIRMDYKKLTDKNLSEALNAILGNLQYKESAERESRLFRDRPMTATNTANFWVEYVIRNGANVLKSPAVELYWWQIELLDVYAFCIFSCLTIVYSIILFVRIVAKKLLNVSKNSEIIKKTN